MPGGGRDGRYHGDGCALVSLLSNNGESITRFATLSWSDPLYVSPVTFDSRMNSARQNLGRGISRAGRMRPVHPERSASRNARFKMLLDCRLTEFIAVSAFSAFPRSPRCMIGSGTVGFYRRVISPRSTMRDTSTSAAACETSSSRASAETSRRNGSRRSFPTSPRSGWPSRVSPCRRACTSCWRATRNCRASRPPRRGRPTRDALSGPPPG